MRRRFALLAALCAAAPAVAAPADVPAGDAAGDAFAADLFPAQSWRPPAPPPAPPRAPEPPRAPPLPFAYLGQLIEGDAVAIFLGRQQRTLIVRAGDTIDGSYRVDAITPRRALFTYLPLDIQQPLILRNSP